MERAAEPVFTAPAPGERARRDASLQETLTRLRYRYWPDHWLGEILAKRWTETAIPVMLLAIVVLISGRVIGNF